MEKKCVIYDEHECTDCGECEFCDLDSSKKCTNCCKCIALDGDYASIDIDECIIDEY